MSERRPTKGDRDMNSKRCVLQCSFAFLVTLSGGGGLAHGEPLNDEAALCASPATGREIDKSTDAAFKLAFE
jgi:hypothetical protein